MTSEPAPQPGPSQSGATSSAKTVTTLGNFRSLPRVDHSDILENWADYASWVCRTSRTLRVSGVLVGDAVANDCEDHAMVILTSRLSKGILQQGRSHVTFIELWSWLDAHYKSNLSEQANDAYSDLVSIKMHPTETIDAYLLRADSMLALLDACKYAYSMTKACRSIVKGLLDLLRAIASP